MPDLLTNGLSGLLAFQRALTTTSHNISNVNTEGYSRQRVELATRPPEAYGFGYIGNGVEVSTIERIYDEFLGGQLRDATAAYSRLDVFNTLASRLDNLLADANAGFAPALADFFNALQDVADDPASIPARQLVLSQADALAARLNGLDRRLDGVERDLNSRLGAAVTEINELARGVAELNEQIATARASTGQPPNDLLDQRELLLKRLSEQVGVRTVEQGDGAINVFVGNGQTLVVGSTARALTAVSSEFDPTRLEIAYAGLGGGAVISAQLSGGALGGLLDFRSEMLDSTRNSLGQIAVGLSAAVNAQSRDGMDLNGQLGSDMFAVGSPVALPATTNSGAAAVTLTIADSTALAPRDYLLRFDGASWSLVGAADGAAVTLTGSGTAADPFTAEGLNIVVSGAAAAGDRFLLQPTRAAAGGFSSLLDRPESVAAAAPIRSAADAANVGDGQISAGEVIDVSDPALLDPVTIEFIDPATYSINGAGAFAYTPGAAVEVNGWRVAISGAPAAGDRFTVEANVGGVGDNRNALLLAEVQGLDFLNGGTTSVDAAYGQLVSKVGAQTREATLNREAIGVVREQAEQEIASRSGVNLDEEAANLLRFQQAYQAAAQVMAVADVVFQTLIAAVRR